MEKMKRKDKDINGWALMNVVLNGLINHYRRGSNEASNFYSKDRLAVVAAKQE